MLSTDSQNNDFVEEDCSDFCYEVFGEMTNYARYDRMGRSDGERR
jgi:hypothetical protein